MSRSALLLLLMGCATPAPDDLLCDEIEAAIASRAEACWGDTEAAIDFAASVQAQCSDPDADTIVSASVDPSIAGLIEGESRRDLFECPLVLRNIACELADDWGEDVALWMSASPVCALMVSP